MNDTSVNELAPVYRFLGQLWLREPSSEILARWQQLQSLIPSATSAHVVFRESLEDLHVEYCRLLIGPSNHFPPFQSVWQTGQMGGAASLSMQRYFVRSGFQVEAADRDVPTDHLGLQLSFYGWLLEQQAASDASETLDVLSEYHAAHLSWADEFLGGVADAAQSDFYRSIAAVTRALL